MQKSQWNGVILPEATEKTCTRALCNKTDTFPLFATIMINYSTFDLNFIFNFNETYVFISFSVQIFISSCLSLSLSSERSPLLYALNNQKPIIHWNKMNIMILHWLVILCHSLNGKCSIWMLPLLLILLVLWYYFVFFLWQSAQREISSEKEWSEKVKTNPQKNYILGNLALFLNGILWFSQYIIGYILGIQAFLLLSWFIQFELNAKKHHKMKANNEKKSISM